jgi:hypothetical protein
VEPEAHGVPTGLEAVARHDEVSDATGAGASPTGAGDGDHTG